MQPLAQTNQTPSTALPRHNQSEIELVEVITASPLRSLNTVNAAANQATRYESQTSMRAPSDEFMVDMSHIDTQAPQTHESQASSTRKSQSAQLKDLYKALPNELKRHIHRQIVLHNPALLNAPVSKDWLAMGAQEVMQLVENDQLELLTGGYLLNTTNKSPQAPYEMSMTLGERADTIDLVYSKGSTDNDDLVSMSISSSRLGADKFNTLKALINKPPTYTQSAAACKQIAEILNLDLETSPLRLVSTPEMKNHQHKTNANIIIPPTLAVGSLLAGISAGLFFAAKGITYEQQPGYVLAQQAFAPVKETYDKCISEHQPEIDQRRASLANCEAINYTQDSCFKPDAPINSDLRMAQECLDTVESQPWYSPAGTYAGSFSTGEFTVSADSKLYNCQEHLPIEYCGPEPFLHDAEFQSASSGLTDTQAYSLGVGSLACATFGSLFLIMCLKAAVIPRRTNKITTAANQQKMQMQQTARHTLQKAADQKNTSHDVFTNTQWRQHQQPKNQSSLKKLMGFGRTS